MPEGQGQGDLWCRAAECPHQRGSPQALPGRDLGELLSDEIEIIGDRREVGSRPIYLVQRERAIVWHAHVVAETSCSIVIPQSSAGLVRLFQPAEPPPCRIHVA